MSSAIQFGRNEASVKRLAAIVLAAGYSSRMGEFKPLLRVGDVTAFARGVDLFHAAGVGEVIAVLGHRADELRKLAEGCGARCVVNTEFERGMYSSIVTGSRALPNWAEAAFVLPADIPLVRASTVRQLAEAWAARRSGIVYPVFSGRRGHPPLIAREILDVAAREGAEGPLSVLLASYEREAVDEPVADEAIHMDMDTHADYEALIAFAARREIPTAAECEALLAARQVAARVVCHSRKVAEVAGKMAAALSRSGVDVDLELVQAGALLHDVAKGQADHAMKGALTLRRMGFNSVAKVVAAHTDLASFLRLDEKAIVYLADKLVCGEEVVTLKERFAPAFTRLRNDSAALEAARTRMKNAKRVARAVESKLGVPLEAVLRDQLDSSQRPAEQLCAREVGTA
jgi:molybdenum cofactor cytidylyltransferase